MKTTRLIRFPLSIGRRFGGWMTTGVVVFLTASFLFAGPAMAVDLKVMKTGLGFGTVTSAPAGINCGADCDETYGSVSVTLTATPAAGSTFSGWAGDCSGTTLTCAVTLSANRSVRADFSLVTAIPTITDFTPEGLVTYLTANPAVNSAARFVKALPLDYKQNWLLMPRSESLQTGTAEFPRILLPSASAQFVFTLGLAPHGSYPGAHPNAIEYMQWDAVQKNFRFHEIVLDAIPALDPDGDGVGVIPARTRGVSIDDDKCSKCHSTRNVLNRGTTAGTDGIPPGSVKYKNKPNWDTYDSWGGMLSFNRDRIYQGSVEAAAFRKTFNLWTWRTNDLIRSIIEQLELQPPGVPPAHAITRTNGGANDGHINFGFDTSPPVLTEPAPSGTDPAITTNYEFNAQAGTGAATSVTRGGSFVTLHHSTQVASDEGRGVELFDRLSAGPNPQRVAHEVVSHRYTPGNVFVDVRPIALAIAQRCITVSGGTNISATQTITSTPPLSAASTSALAFFTTRNGVASFDQLYDDTRLRAWSLTRRKADIQKLNLDRLRPGTTLHDVYLDANEEGLIQQYGAATSVGASPTLSMLRQEVFRRPTGGFSSDTTVMGGIYVDRELVSNTDPVSLYRYFLEPLGVSVDKWSMGVRGRSRTYTFADLFGGYMNTLAGELKASLGISSSLSSTEVCNLVIPMVDSMISSLPPANAVPTYTDVQRVFNKNCIECHGGLDYPPYGNYGSILDLSENETPPVGQDRLDRSHELVVSAFTTNDPRTSYLYRRICPGAATLPDVNTPCPMPSAGSPDNEDCPFGIMPCGGPRLSHSDIETVRRWIVGPPSRPNTRGDPHIKTVDGVNYDFQAAGEYVLLRGQGLEIQARQTAVETDGALGPNPHTGLTSCVSVNTAAAVRVGRHRITYQPNLSGEPDPEGLQLRIDGKLTKMGDREILLPSGGRIVRTTVPGGIQIEAPGGAAVTITPGWWNHYQLWYMNIDASNVRATEGLMGAIAPGNWLPALPDGTRLGPRPTGLQQRYVDLYDKFGNAWRVSNATTLFDYAPGTSTATFIIPSWPKGESPQSCALPRQPGGRPTPPQTRLALADAQKHCKDIVADDARANCVQDVMVTGEPGFAKTYLLGERIERNARPTAPVLDSPKSFALDLAKPVTFTWGKAFDADGDTLTYRHCVWDVHERFTFSKCTADSIRLTPWRGGLLCAVVVLLIGVLVIAVLIVMGMKNKPGLLVLVAIVVLVAAILALYLCGSKTASRTVAELESGKAYYWKVIAEDGKGGTTESETRRFAVK